MSSPTFCIGILSLFLVINHIAAFFDYYVAISNNGPAVIGSTITFTAELFNSEGKRPTGTFKYRWRDNLEPQHVKELKSNAVSIWNVTYPASETRYKPGRHFVAVDVYTEKIIIDWPLCNGRAPFELTDELNGNLTLKQNSVVENSQYISNAAEVLHEIDLTFPDATFLKNNVSFIKTQWLIDCRSVGYTSDLTFRYNYTKADVSHVITAFIYASNESHNNNSSSNVTHSSADNITLEDTLNSTTTPSDIYLNTIADSSNSTKFSYLTVNNATENSSTPLDVQFDCPNRKLLNRKQNATYGSFSRIINVKAPVTNVTTQGNPWLKHGDMLNLQVLCEGSGPFKGCYHYQIGYYNKTGNETCEHQFEFVWETCNFSCSRYFQIADHYSLVVVIHNDINKVVRSIGIDVYEVTKHPQLSVIVVPVSASIAAVVLIIFGIAYYIQSRNRFIVEVADFDFSTNANDMEYKTFRERLMEAVHNAFDKTEDFYEQDSTNGVPTNNKKYGSMQ